jgi:hypothetical protein
MEKIIELRDMEVTIHSLLISMDRIIKSKQITSDVRQLMNKTLLELPINNTVS